MTTRVIATGKRIKVIYRIKGNSIADYDVSVLYGLKNILLKAGYRSVKTSTENLDGPYIGFSIRY